MTSGRPTLLLLDGHSLAYRAFFALPEANFATTTGQPTNAVYGFTSMLINLLRDENPTHIAVAFDVSRKTFRSETFPEYKATRSASPEGFKGQVELIRQVLDAMSIRNIAVDGYEADDVIATLTDQGVRTDMDVLIVTGDRDAFQLVKPGVTVLYPKKGVSDLARMTPEAVREKYGLTPAQYPDFAALRGDPSDNLPGIAGVGEKTAAKWINEYGSLAELVARVDEVPGKAGQALRDALPQVLTNAHLTRLVHDVPLDIAVEDLVRGSIQREAVHELFDTLQFRVLRERLFAALGESVAGNSSTAEGIELAISHQVASWLAAAGTQRVGVYVAGEWGQGTGRVDAIAMAIPGSACVVEWQSLTKADSQALKEFFADGSRSKAMHDAKGPLLALNALGWQLHGLTADTALSAYLIVPGQRAFDLADLVLRFLKRELPTTSAQDNGQLALGGVAIDQMWLAHAALAIADLSKALDEVLIQRGSTTLLADVELPLVSLLAQMEATGIAVDRQYLNDLEAEFARSVAQVEAQAHDIAGRVFNLGSPKQLQEILFGERKLPKTKKIKTGYTTDADALLWLTTQSDDPLPETLLRWRDVSRLRQTVEGLLRSVAPDGRIHTTFNQMIAATGRLSSTEPNLQNIPVRTEDGRRIREAFVVGKGYSQLMTADYSQIEMRIMAHLSGDEGLITAFRSGEDLHTTVASQVFGVKPDDVDAEMRRRIKAMSYGLAYGLSSFGLAQQLDISASEANALMEEYFKRFGGIRDYLHDVVEKARATGYTETILGRRRYLPDLTSDNRPRREIAERMALNAPIQGSAADIIKVAMLTVDRELRAAQCASRLLLQVHDELVLEVAPGEEVQVEEIVRRGMGGAATMDVALEVSVGLGRSWHEAAH